MSIPGANVLSMAMRILGQQTFQYFAFMSRATNSIGQDVATYAPPQSVKGSVQAVPRRLYQQYGLEFDRYYVMVYVPQSVLDVGRDVSGDALMYNSAYYQVLSKTDWYTQDGWVIVLAVQVPSLPGTVA